MSARPSSNAFEDLVREHHAAVYRAAQRIVLNADDAQDVTQQVFLQVLEQGARFDDAENPRAVLCWMASRKALTHRRGNRRRQEREAERAAMNRENEMREMHEGAMEQDERTMFGGIFRRLPEELRLALSLRFQDGMTYDQIGDVLTISGASAHDRVRRGLDRLRDSLRRGGLAAFAVDVEHRLAESSAEPIPTGLVERLLELKQATLASGVSLTLGAVLIGVTIVAGAFGVILWTPDGAGAVNEPVAVSVDLEREDVPLPAVEPTTSGRVALGRSGTEASGTLGASGGATATADERTGTISGRITTPDGGPAEGVTVVASSHVLAGKVSAWGGRSSTDAQGRYALEVPVRHDDGEDYRVYVKYDEATITRSRSSPLPTISTTFCRTSCSATPSRPPSSGRIRIRSVPS